MEKFLKPKKLNVSAGSSIGHVECPDDIGTFCSGPVQPRIGVTFPIDSDGRKFSPEWYRRFTWLEYSQKRDAAFCYGCRHFAPSSLNNATFALKGYRGWKRALGDKNKGLELHCRAATHLEAVSRWEERKQRARSQNTVTEMVSNNVYERRRYYVRAIAEVIKFIAVNELSFRGHYDKVLHRECGLFTDLFDFTVSRDKYLQEIINEIPANATYKSPDIQNDVIDIMAKMVTQSVVNDVNGADVPHATLLSDGTRDKNNRENISIALRYVKGGQPFESLLYMPETQELDAASLAKLLLKTLHDTGINIDYIMSQCYDGASVMRGDKGGVQRLIQNELGREIPYVHCFNHRLHLVVVNVVTRINAIKQYFDHVSLIYSFFQKIKAAEIYEGSSIKRILDTRWNGHLSAIVAILSNYAEIADALQKIGSNQLNQFDGETVVTAVGLAAVIATRDFRFISVMMKRVLELLKPADESLQKRTTDINEVMLLIETCMDQVCNLRNEAKFVDISKCCNELVYCEPSAKRRMIATPSRRMDDFVVLEPTGQYRREEATATSQMLNDVIDNVLVEMTRRFTDQGWLYKAVTAMSRKSDKFLDAKTLSPLSRLGIVIPSNAELQVCKAYIERLNSPVEESDSNKVLKLLYEQRAAFPDTYAMAASIATLGSSSAVCEASFSTLARINNSHRRSMTHMRQRNLVLLAFEENRTKDINFDEFIKMFMPKHSRLHLC